MTASREGGLASLWALDSIHLRTDFCKTLRQKGISLTPADLKSHTSLASNTSVIPIFRTLALAPTAAHELGGEKPQRDRRGVKGRRDLPQAKQRRAADEWDRGVNKIFCRTGDSLGYRKAVKPHFSRSFGASRCADFTSNNYRRRLHSIKALLRRVKASLWSVTRRRRREARRATLNNKNIHLYF